MKPWILLDEAQVPGSPLPLRLYRREAEFSIKTGAYELMNSRMHGSEEDLARLGCATLGSHTRPRVLVGGLGMGFTLAATLRILPAHAQVTVCELVPAVVEWNRGPLGELTGFPVQDPRVEVVSQDVSACIREAANPYDAILLDVDNGPEALTHPGNSRLYGDAGLLAAAQALRPRGALAIWSVSPDARFVKRLRRAQFVVEEHMVKARAGRGNARRVVWIARRGV